MLDEEVAEALQTLTLVEVKVLYWKCRGLSASAIGKKIGGGEYLVNIHLNNICYQLNLDPDLHPAVLERRLRQDIYPILLPLVTRLGGIERLVEWPCAIPMDASPGEIPVTGPRLMRSPTPSAKNRFEPIFILLVILLIAVIGLSILLVQMSPWLRSKPSAGSSALPTAVVQPTSTAIPTYTPYPSVFEDRFDRGISAQWQVIAGEARVSDGRLSGSPDVWLALSQAWNSYQVSFEGAPAGCGLTNVDYVIPRFINAQEFAGFYWSDCTTYWSWVHAGAETRVQGSGKSGAWPGPSKIVLTVRNHEFFVSIDGSDHKSIVNDQFDQGVFAIHIGHGSWIDNLSIIQLPDS